MPPIEELKAELDATSAEYEVQTDKTSGKIVPCVKCAKPLIVNTFYAPAKAQCADCGGVKGVGLGDKIGATPEELKAGLVNPQFGQALCPVHPDDESHEMKLIQAVEVVNYGPSTHVGYDGAGRPVYKQHAPGESVIHQCQKCRATVSYSSAHVQLYNAPSERQKKDSTRPPGIVMRRNNGTRDEDTVHSDGIR